MRAHLATSMMTACLVLVGLTLVSHGQDASNSPGASGSASGSGGLDSDSPSSSSDSTESSTAGDRSNTGSPTASSRDDRPSGSSRDDDSRVFSDTSDEDARDRDFDRSSSSRARSSEESSSRSRAGSRQGDESRDAADRDRAGSTSDSDRARRASTRRRQDDESYSDEDSGSADRDRENASIRARSRSDLGISLSRSDSEDLTVENIDDDSAAARAGLRDGDEIISVNGREISSRSEFDRWVRDLDPGASLQLSVRRDGRQRSFSLELDEAAGGRRDDFNAGLSFSMDDEDRLVVSRLDRRSFWGQSGVRRGDVILSIDDRDVESRADFLRWVHQERGDEPLTLIVLRDGRRQTFQVDVESNRDELYPQQQRSTLGVMLDQESENGALVSRVYRGSAADKAGLRRGDYIVRFDGDRVRSADHLIQLVGQHEPGSTVQIEFTRREQQAVNATLGASSTSQNGSLTPTRLRRDNEDMDGGASISIDLDDDRREIRRRVRNRNLDD